MFDTHIHRKGDSFHKTEITENRAPTDESVRLLKEMEKAALDRLLSITRLQNNTLEATWHVFQDPARDEMEALCRFLLNGREHRIKVTLDRSMRYNPKEAAKKIHEAVTREIAAILTVELFDAADVRNMLR